MSLMERMKVASDLQNMSMGEKFFGGIQVAIFGIAIVFLALLLLFLVIKALETALGQKEKPKQASAATKETAKPQVEEPAAIQEEPQDDSQLVAVITAAVAASLHTSTHNIIVRNIVRVPDATPAWGRLGRMQQVNRME